MPWCHIDPRERRIGAATDLHSGAQIRLLGLCRHQQSCRVVVVPGFTGSPLPRGGIGGGRTAPSPYGSVGAISSKESGQKCRSLFVSGIRILFFAGRGKGTGANPNLTIWNRRPLQGSRSAPLIGRCWVNQRLDGSFPRIHFLRLSKSYRSNRSDRGEEGLFGIAKSGITNDVSVLPPANRRR